MKTVKIPTHMHPFVCYLNGERFTFEAGSTVEVSDELAAVIEKSEFRPPVNPIVPSGGGVSSWNDLTDKPFYAETAEVVLADEQITGSENTFSTHFVINVGEKYTVEYDGEIYELTAWDNDDEYYVIGDYDYIEAPFNIAHEYTYPSANAIFQCNDENEHHVRIIHKQETVHKLEPTFVPDEAFNTYRIWLSYLNDGSLSATPDFSFVKIEDALMSGKMVYAEVWDAREEVSEFYQLQITGKGNDGVPYAKFSCMTYANGDLRAKGFALTDSAVASDIYDVSVRISAGVS